jgi:prevent-host-death family protein
MKCVNIAELKNRLTAYLGEVKAGKEIVVRDRHRPIARIVPISPNLEPDEELRALEAEGKVRLGKGPIDDSFWELPAPRVPIEALRRSVTRDRDER